MTQMLSRSAGTPGDNGHQHSGALVRPIDQVRRSTAGESTAQTDLERYKVAMRRYDPVQTGLPWACQAHCVRCDTVVPATFELDKAADRVELVYDCPNCGQYREPHHDVFFVKDLTRYREAVGLGQPTTTHSGSIIRPVAKELPKTVETLCPECSSILLGRYYEKDGAVYIEKTCPEHGYCRDTVNTDVEMFRRAQHGVFEDGRGVLEPQVTGGTSCPSHCGLCGQHLSTSVLAQIDLTNRCNLTCPICFANANAAGYVSEPTYEMVVEMLRTLRNHKPLPATAVQFTGGEPTLHPEFHRCVRTANEMGFSHVQIATNGITHADLDFAQRSAEAGLHTLYLQFDGVDDRFYRKTRNEALFDKKLACIENCKKTGMKVCLVPTIIKGFNDDQVEAIFKFAVEHIDAVSGIAYQPVAFTGRINHREREAQRYTLGDLAHGIAKASGGDVYRDCWPLGLVGPLSRIMSCLDGKPKITASCHSDCAFGTYYFVTPEHKAIPIPALFDIHGLMDGFNRLAKKIKARHEKASTWERLKIAALFFRHYRWRNLFMADIRPWTFIRALQGLTDKKKGRGAGEKKSYKTLLAAGMHFMDRYNYDTARVRRCVILYSTVDGVYPFCAINGGPEYRPYIEKMYAETKEEWQARNPGCALRPSIHATPRAEP
ncbi:MAG: radical SAM protein [Phycisphaerae bacterium]|nr:radical SAM protein [Phycisphaerae bacterium]